MFKPREYQQDAIDAVLDWIKVSIEPCLVEAATGAGKSIIVALAAKWIEENTGKKVLCLAPSTELTEQNFEKYESYELKASYYSASLGKSLRHNVVFGTPLTVKNNVKQFARGNFGAVIVDECHNITPTIKKIIADIREENPNLRVVGLTATPYRLNDGYIFRYWPDGKPVDEDQTKDPYFHTCVYRITAPYLIKEGYLTQPHADPNHAESYDTSGIKRHTEKEYEQVFEGKGRKTYEIVKDVVAHSAGRMGTMIFAATVQHAQECMESLPKDNSRLITGETPKTERKQIIDDFKARRFKYLVNVAVLTTGFDAPHVDVIAILRATESASLLQQIIGRGMRLHPEKSDCLVLDYAGNIERHQLEDDLFSPIIQARHSKKGEPMDVPCPLCSTINSFSMRKNPDEFGIDADGDFVDLAGNKIMTDKDIPMPAHYGRRCFGYSLHKGVSNRCEHRWSIKECHECGHENDIAARYCEKCKAELVDPSEKLQIEFKRMKADPHTRSTDEVKAFALVKHISKAGNETLKATYVTEYATFDIWYSPDSHIQFLRNLYEDFSKAYFNGKVCPTVDMFIENKDKGYPPKTITYQRNKAKKYYNAFAHNLPADKEPDIETT